MSDGVASLFGMVMITAAELNEQIRQLVAAGRAGSEEYQLLLVEWAAAVRAEQELAA